MPYLLDGNNLVGRARRSARPDDADRAALVAELCDRLRRTKARVLAVFDGPVPAGAAQHLGGLSVRFSGSVAADEVLLREIARSPAPGEVTLVTADRDLARRARDAGARVLSPEEFWKRFGPSGESARSEPARVDVDDWLRYFQDERNRR